LEVHKSWSRGSRTIIRVLLHREALAERELLFHWLFEGLEATEFGLLELGLLELAWLELVLLELARLELGLLELARLELGLLLLLELRWLYGSES